MLDDGQAVRSGEWTASTSVRPFVGAGYLHDAERKHGVSTARFEFRAATTGRARVDLAWQSHANRARAVPITIEVHGAITRLELNQTRSPSLDALWQPLGEYELQEGERITVTVSNADTSGHVTVDAARLVMLR